MMVVKAGYERRPRRTILKSVQIRLLFNAVFRDDRASLGQAVTSFTSATHIMSLFDSMKDIQIPTTEAEKNEVVISESTHGVWDYHLSRRSNILRGLCGTPTLPTKMPLSAWGEQYDENLPKKPSYCKKCEERAWPDGKPDLGSTAKS